MSYINISLVGGQTYPVYLGISDNLPDKIILIHSERSKEEAERIAKEANLPTEYVLFDPVNVNKIFTQATKMRESLSPDNQYMINITSGTKVWTIAFYEIFKDLTNVEFIYIDQNNIIYNLTKNTQSPAKVVLDTELVLRLNGTKIKKLTSLKDYNEEDKKVLNQIKEVRSNAFITEFNILTIPQKMNQVNSVKFNNEGIFETPLGSTVEWNKKEGVVSMSLKNKHGNIKSKKLKSPHVTDIVFFSGWFEYEIAEMLSHWKYAKEIIMNVVFPYNDDKPKNEIDVIVNTGNRLLFVECKTQINDITDIDKFRTAIKNYGGMGCKGLFITEATMKDTAAEKCKDSDILCFSLQDCGNLMDPQKALSMKLETELFEINKK